MIAITAITASAQIKNIKLGREFTVDNLYVGLLSSTAFSIDSLSATGSSNLRIGTEMTYKPLDWLAIKARGMVQAQVVPIQGKPTLSGTSLEQLSIKVMPFKRMRGLSLTVGSMPTLPTEQKPNPITDAGQFETEATKHIVKMALNAKAVFEVDSTFKIGAGIALRDKKPEYSGVLKYKPLLIAGWYTVSEKKFGVAMTLDIRKRVVTTFVWRQKQVIANVFVLKFGKHNQYQVYSDFGLDIKNHKLIRSETGILVEFTSRYIKGLYCLGWDNQNRFINGYFFIHL